MKKLMVIILANALALNTLAAPKPNISLTLIPPSPVTDQIKLDIRGAVWNHTEEMYKYDIAVYLDEETAEKCLHKEQLDVASQSTAGFKFWWQTNGQAGSHLIILTAKRNGKTLRMTRPLQVLASDVRSTRRIDGTWCSFNMPESGRTKCYDPELSQMTNDQWREMVRGMHDIGMNIIIIQESVHNYRHNRDGKEHYALDDYSAKAFYPSTIFKDRMPMVADDPIEAIFNEADKLGMYVFAGVGLFAWFDYTPASIEWHKRLTDELWESYGHHSSFYGWYISEEKTGSLGNAAERQQIIDFFNEYTTYIRRLTPDKPVMLAPNAWFLGGVEDIYRKLLPHVDILCSFAFNRMPKDDMTGEQAATLLQSLCNEAETHLWMDMEIFLFNNEGDMVPRPIDGLLSDLIRFPNFEKIVCYQYPGLMTAPNASIYPGGKSAVKLYQDYKRYFETLKK